ncbi:MAG: sigma-54 dependent transcriptional regulator [Planctomycetota bacterium]
MPAEPTRILVVDDDPVVADGLADLLRTRGHAAATAHDGAEALALLDDVQQKFDLLITDLNLPRTGGIELLEAVRDRHRDVVPIVVTGFGKIDAAVRCIKLGAADYLTKPVVDEALLLAVEKAAHRQALLAENDTLKQQLDGRFGLGQLVGDDPAMQRVYDLVEAVADSKTTVLVTGESGTGKSLVGRAIHTLSPRGADRRRGSGKRPGRGAERRRPDPEGRRPCGPFVTFACGSVPETLLESELFGHVRGAFTGAEDDKPGRVLAADGGTLFLDEINSATPALQLKLLRVLQEKAFEPLGSTQTHHVDVRFVLATNRDLRPMVEAGTFREDLYYRINVVNIAMPALRDRRGDIPALAEHFLAKHAAEAGRTRTLGDAALDALRSYGWPGNVRELENAIERAVVLSRGPVIGVDDLPDAVREGATTTAGYVPAVLTTADDWVPTPLAQAMREPERRILKAALEANGWNRQETARQLEINRTTLYKKIKDFGLDRPDAAG